MRFFGKNIFKKNTTKQINVVSLQQFLTKKIISTMKKFALIFAFIFATITTSAQTTEEEYNYITKGYKIIEALSIFLSRNLMD